MGRYPHDIKGPKSWSDFKSSYPISRFIISEKLHSPFVNGVWTVQYSQLGSLNSMMMDTVTDVPPDKSFFNGCFFYGCNYHSLILIRTHWFLTMTTTKLILINQTQHHKKHSQIHHHNVRVYVPVLWTVNLASYPCLKPVSVSVQELTISGYSPLKINKVATATATATDSEIILKKGPYVAEIPKTRIRISCICVSIWKCPTMFLFFSFLVFVVISYLVFLAAPFNFSLFAFCFTASSFRISLNGRPGRDYLVYLGLPAINPWKYLHYNSGYLPTLHFCTRTRFDTTVKMSNEWFLLSHRSL